MTRLSWLLVVTLLAGCSAIIGPEQAARVPAFSFFNSYSAALNDFEKGRIMTARARILAMDKSREDYPQAAKLLKQRVEPTRLKLLKLYSGKGEAAERSSEWSQAMAWYAQAAELSTAPESLQKKVSSMEINMRQARMDSLIHQRRDEDSKLLAWLQAYEPPKGVDAKDDVFGSEREEMLSMVEDRASLAYRDARRYLGKDLPEVAYVEAESYLRFVPDSERGLKVMADVKAAMPKSIRIASVKSGGESKPLSKRIAMPETVKREQVVELMRQDDWVNAKKFALVYRREGGKGAQTLLNQIQKQLEKDASEHFANGRLAFRQEKLDEAIGHWEKSAALMPESIEYVQALQRALQLRERLRVLKETNAEKGPE